MADEQTETAELTKQQKKNRKKREAQKIRKKKASQDTESSQTKENGSPLATHTGSGSQSNLFANDDTDNFDIELSWCVEQLRLGLVLQKATAEQAKETERIIRQLNSAKAPKPKKRQIMRSVFGDYRKKMEADAKQFIKDNENNKGISKAPRPCISSSSTDKGKGVFVKKKSGSDNSNRSKVENEAEKSEGAFRFNFPNP